MAPSATTCAPPKISKEYPTANETKVLEAAEALMEKAMAKFDPSHDAFHGK